MLVGAILHWNWWLCDLLRITGWMGIMVCATCEQTLANFEKFDSLRNFERATFTWLIRCATRRLLDNGNTCTAGTRLLARPPLPLHRTKILWKYSICANYTNGCKISSPWSSQQISAFSIKYQGYTRWLHIEFRHRKYSSWSLFRRWGSFASKF